MSEETQRKAARRAGSCPKCGAACRARDAELVRGTVWTRCPSCLEMFEGTWSDDIPQADPTKHVLERPAGLEDLSDHERTLLMIESVHVSRAGAIPRNVSEELTPIAVPTRLTDFARTVTARSPRHSSVPPCQKRGGFGAGKIPSSVRAAVASVRNGGKSRPVLKKRKGPPPLPAVARKKSARVAGMPESMAKATKELSIPLPILQSVVHETTQGEALVITPTEPVSPLDMARLLRPRPAPREPSPSKPEPPQIVEPAPASRLASVKRRLRIFALVGLAAALQIVLGGLLIEGLHRALVGPWGTHATTRMTAATYATRAEDDPVGPRQVDKASSDRRESK